MMRKRLNYLFTKNRLELLSKTFLQGLGIFWLLIEFISFFFSNLSLTDNIILIISIIISLIAAIFIAIPPIIFQKHSRSSNVIIQIYVGNLLEQDTHLAIVSSDTFDTEYPAVIGEHTLKAQLIKRYFGGDVEKVDSMIMQSMNSQNIKGCKDENKRFGKSIRYPMGTIAVLPVDKQTIYLSIACTIQNDQIISMSKDELWQGLSGLWDMFRKNGQLETLSIPVWGAGLARAQASRLSLMQIILMSFAIATRESKVTKCLNLVIYEKEYDPHELIEMITFMKSLEF